MKRYDHIDRSPPKGVREACANGVERFEAGEGGDGLEDVTIREARALARGEEPGWTKINKLIRFWGRNERFLDSEPGTPAWTSAQLWGGRAGRDWANSLEEQMRAADKKAGIENTVRSTRRAVIAMGEQDRVTIRLFTWGEVVHPKLDFEVTREFASELIENFEKLAADGYFPPILEEHQARGKAFGLIVGLSVDEDGVLAEVELAKGIKQEVDDGFRPYVSPAFFPEWKHPHTGETLKNVLREVSFVGVPHLKNLAPAGQHYALSEDGWGSTTDRTQEAAMADETAPETADETIENEEHDEMSELRERMAEMEERLAKMEESYAKMMEGYDDDGEDEDDDDEPMENSDRIAALERRLALAEAERDVAQRVPGLDSEDAAALAEALVANSAAGERLIAMAAKGLDAPKTAKTVQTPNGKSGQAKVGPVSFAEAWDEIVEDLGTADASKVAAELERRYPKLAGASVIN